MRTFHVHSFALLLLAACPGGDDGETDGAPTTTSSGATTEPATDGTSEPTGTTDAATDTGETTDAPGTTSAPTTGPLDTTTGTTTDSTSTTGTTDTTGTASTDGTDTDPSTGDPAMLPGDLLDLTNWKLTLPVDTDHPGSPDEIEQPELATFVDPLYYHLNDTLDGVVFRAHAGGDTTDNSGYPRSELREMTDQGAEEAAWSSSRGTHRMFIDQAITHLPVEKPHIVVGQIHDDEDDVIVFRLEGSKLFIDLNGDDGPVLTEDYQLGDRFTVAFEVSDDHVDCYYNDTFIYSHPQAFSGAYFKAGAYVQSSCQGEKEVPGESCDAYGEVVIYDVSVEHT
ncbi:Alginate lyase [Nannocystis exedens]|uniref:Alginate lyase n=1 Tax=Nannocystis exedens TaxID=54 RepID=A0A1I2HMH6_9BACT|nr:polysaccharide lyase family 7 protein [Nannocystis exedens]PCC71965.1 Alginate lyase precursor [Nannocystis exedens]SFF30643.1 Alginate lyase [Nannocystis exedens]